MMCLWIAFGTITFQRETDWSNDELSYIPPQPDSRRRPPTIPYSGGSAPVPAAMASAPPAPPKPPRDVTPAAKRRSWGEPMVRFWLLSTTVLVVIAVWFVGEQVKAYKDEQRLINTGSPVDATVVEVNGDSRVGAQFPPGLPATLKFTLNNETTSVTGVLSYESDHDFITNGQIVRIHVNPNDLSDWTNLKEAEPVGRRLIAGVMILPIAIATALAGILLRKRMLRCWRESEAAAYSVVDTGHSALAPLSHAVRCVAVTGRDQNLVTVYLPARFPRPQTGDVLWLLHPPGKPKASIAAQAFE